MPEQLVYCVMVFKVSPPFDKAAVEYCPLAIVSFDGVFGSLKLAEDKFDKVCYYRKLDLCVPHIDYGCLVEIHERQIDKPGHVRILKSVVLRPEAS